MKIWGYVLIALNLIAAGAFVYFGWSLYKIRSDFQYTYLKQELANVGLPLEPPPKSDEEIDEGFVAFPFTAGPITITQISIAKLERLIPKGGDVYGVKGNKVITNQFDEVARVEEIVFTNLDAIKSLPERRVRLMVQLLDLSKGQQRDGVYALLRDYPIEKRRAYARIEMASLGRTGPQVSALRALAGVGEANSGYGPNLDPTKVRLPRVKAGRKALIGWALGEIPNATAPNRASAIPPLPSDNAPPLTAEQEAVKAEQDRIAAVLNSIATEMEADAPNAANIAAGKQKLLELLEGSEALTSSAAAVLIPYMAEIGTNLLDSEQRVADARAKIVELLQLRAVTNAEKKALNAIAELMVPLTPLTTETMDQTINTAATELLRAYFEEAQAQLATELPTDVEEARAKLKDLKAIRGPAEKRRNIAHLLYHLDCHVGISKETRHPWYNSFVSQATKDGAGDYKMRPADEELLKNRIAWHQRVVAVVGLEGYVPVVEAQASEIAQQVQEIKKRITEEQKHFESEYQKVVHDAFQLATNREIRQAEVKELERRKTEAENQLKDRLAEKAKLEAELANATAVTKKSLDLLAEKVEELFTITKQLGEAQDALVGLEIYLRDLELDPAKGAKKK